jgi:hypothetical protein
MADRTPIVEPKAESAIAFWRVPWEFAVHAIVGTLIFGIIAAAAVALSLFVLVLEGYHTDSVIIFGLKSGEYGLFAVDLALFAVFLWRTAKRTIKRL